MHRGYHVLAVPTWERKIRLLLVWVSAVFFGRDIIPLATVQSPDQLTTLPGNIFVSTSDSGNVEMGFANEAGMGSVVSGALENSNVDIAEELTNMIESQRSYTANSKVFQTGADLMDILVNLKR